MAQRRFIAVDLGAESGRVVAGELSGGRLSTQEVHRFPNEPVLVRGTLYWDVLALYNNILKGLSACRNKFGPGVDGIGVDTWAVDFGLLAADGSLLQNPVCYRDHRTDGMPDVVRSVMPEAELYEKVGIFLLPIYTLCQMLSLRRAESPVLKAAARFLMMPDLLAYFLCGRQACERTNAITTQLYDPRSGQWHREVFRAFDLPLSIMPELVDPGTVLGELDERVKAATGLERAQVIAPCTHDTGSAVAAVPATGADWAFLSCGTWSIVGSLTDQVVTTRRALAAGLCNEMTLGSFFLCQNIMGLWLLQQARACWAAEGRQYSYPELAAMAQKAGPATALLSVNDQCFLAPPDMLQSIGEFCRRTGQPAPEGPAQVTRCILESLALSYRYALDQIGSILGKRFGVLHIVGGGSQNALLCQLTADATGLPVLAGPAEATVAGNLLVQAYAAGCLDSPQAIRSVVAASAELAQYRPTERARWEELYGKYCELVERRTA